MAAIQFTEATKAYPRTIAPAGKYPIVGDRIYRTLQDAQDYVDGKSSSKSAIPGIYLSVIDDGINNGAYWVEQAAGYDGATVGVLRKMGAGGGGGGDISLAWDDITGKPSFAAVATSGSYDDLTDKPTIPDLSVLGALAYKDNLSWSEIMGRPTKLSDFTNDAGFITSAALAGYLKEEDAETIYITEEEAEDRYVKRGGDSINGDISFGGSIKIGGATLSWDEASHALKVDTSFYSTKQLASGGIGDASGSGLGLILNEWPTASEDYSKYALGGNLGIELNTRLTAVEGKATNVTVSPTLSQGKPMGTIMVDGVSQTMYAPASYSADDIVPTQERNFVSLQDIEHWNTAYLPKTGGTLKGSLVPDKDGAYHLGSPSYRLGVVFALQGVFYGGLSINHESVATQTWAEERYLKLSGGAIGRDGSNSFPLNIESTSSYTGIAFVTSGGRAWMRYMGGSDWGVTDAEWKNSYTLIHSGNIGSQSVNYATNSLRYKVVLRASSSNRDLNTALAGGGMARTYNNEMRGDFTNAPSNASFGSVIQFSTADQTENESLSGQLAWDVNHASTTDATRYLWWRAADENGYTNAKWHRIAFTDSNVASATKLATARTIWGQSFDGTGNVSGSLYFGANTVSIYGYDSTDSSNVEALYLSSTYKQLQIGPGTSVKGYNTYIHGNELYLRYGTSKANGLILNSSGNVTIGASDLAETTAKLYVEGDRLAVKLTTKTEMRLYAENSLARLGILIALSGNRGIYDYTTDAWVIATNGTNTWLAKGNVGIGTTSPEYKLDVNGSSRLAWDGSANSAIANATSFKLNTTATGGWARSFLITNNGTTMFAFGALGTGGSLTYGYVGSTYANPWVSFDSEKVQFNKNIRIGSAVLSWDSTNNALKIEGNVYATGQVASGGIGTAVATIASDHEDRIAQLEAKVESLMS